MCVQRSFRLLRGLSTTQGDTALAVLQPRRIPPQVLDTIDCHLDLNCVQPRPNMYPSFTDHQLEPMRLEQRQLSENASRQAVPSAATHEHCTTLEASSRSTNPNPNDPNNHIQPLAISAGVLKTPHAVSLIVPIGTARSVHATTTTRLLRLVCERRG